MKKLLFISIFLSLLFIANNSFAITPGTIPSAGQLGISDAPQISSVDTLIGIVKNIVKYIYIIFFLVAVIFILFAAYTYLTAQGEPEEVNKARTQIMYAVIAIVVALMAVSVDLIVKNLITTGGDSGGDQYWPQQGYNIRVQPFKDLPTPPLLK